MTLLNVTAANLRVRGKHSGEQPRCLPMETVRGEGALAQRPQGGRSAPERRAAVKACGGTCPRSYAAAHRDAHPSSPRLPRIPSTPAGASPDLTLYPSSPIRSYRAASPPSSHGTALPTAATLLPAIRVALPLPGKAVGAKGLQTGAQLTARGAGAGERSAKSRHTHPLPVPVRPRRGRACPPPTAAPGRRGLVPAANEKERWAGPRACVSGLPRAPGCAARSRALRGALPGSSWAVGGIAIAGRSRCSCSPLSPHFLKEGGRNLSAPGALRLRTSPQLQESRVTPQSARAWPFV